MESSSPVERWSATGLLQHRLDQIADPIASFTADGGYEFSHLRRGDTTDLMLDYVGYDLNALREEYRSKIARAGIAGDEAERLRASGFGAVTTEIAPAGPFYYAEDYHQQYLEKNPWGYCGIGGTGVSCPVGVGLASSESAAQ